MWSQFTQNQSLAEFNCRNVDSSAADVHSANETDDNFSKLLDKFHDAIWKIAGLIVALVGDKKVEAPRYGVGKNMYIYIVLNVKFSTLPL